MKTKSSRARAAHAPREAEIHRLIGGDLSLDFANTLNGHTRVAGHEYLHHYADLVLWARHAGILTPRDAGLLLKTAASHLSSAADVYRKALMLREAIFRVFTAFAFGDRPAEDDLNQLNAVWRAGQRHASLVRSPAGFAIGWDDDLSLERIPRTISISAIHLLTSEKTGQIRRCHGDQCDWLFIDSSRNHLRRWCSMDECGNRAKMRRRQDRKRLFESN